MYPTTPSSIVHLYLIWMYSYGQITVPANRVPHDEIKAIAQLDMRRGSHFCPCASQYRCAELQGGPQVMATLWRVRNLNRKLNLSQSLPRQGFLPCARED